MRCRERVIEEAPDNLSTKEEKERCSGSYCQAIGFLNMTHIISHLLTFTHISILYLVFMTKKENSIIFNLKVNNIYIFGNKTHGIIFSLTLIYLVIRPFS